MKEDSKEVKGEIVELKKALEFQSKTIEELIKENSKRKDSIERQDSETNQLKSHIKTLENTVEELEDTQDNIHQYQRKHNLVFHGIPERKDEDLVEALKEIGEALDVEVEEETIDIVHRMASKQRPRPVIVRYLNYSAKKKLYQARRNLKKVDAEHWENTNCLYGVTQINIDENLTKVRAALFAEIRKRAKQYGWYSAWTLDGNIYVKKTKDGKN